MSKEIGKGREREEQKTDTRKRGNTIKKRVPRDLIKDRANAPESTSEEHAPESTSEEHAPESSSRLHRDQRVANLGDAIEHNRTELGNFVAKEPKDVELFTLSSDENRPELEAFLDTIQQTVDDMKARALKNYLRKGKFKELKDLEDLKELPSLIGKLRGYFNNSKATRQWGEQELEELVKRTSEQLQELTAFFEMGKEERVVDSIAKMIRREGSAVIVDLDRTIIDSDKGRDVGMTMPPDFIKCAQNLMDSGVRVAIVTGRAIDLVIENFRRGGADSSFISRVHIYGENGMMYRGPDTNGKEIALDERVSNLIPLSKQLQDTIEERIKADPELKDRAESDLIGLSRKNVGATVQGLRYSTSLREYLEGSGLPQEDVEERMTSINEKIYGIVESSLKEKESEYGGAFIIENTGIKGIEIRLNPETGIEISKGRAVVDLVRRCGLSGSVVSFGDDGLDLAMPEALGELVSEGTLRSQVFVGVELAEGQTLAEIRQAASFMTDGPNHTVEFIGKIAAKIRETREIVEQPIASSSTQPPKPRDLLPSVSASASRREPLPPASNEGMDAQPASALEPRPDLPSPASNERTDAQPASALEPSPELAPPASDLRTGAPSVSRPESRREQSSDRTDAQPRRLSSPSSDREIDRGRPGPLSASGSRGEQSPLASNERMGVPSVSALEPSPDLPSPASDLRTGAPSVSRPESRREQSSDRTDAQPRRLSSPPSDQEIDHPGSLSASASSVSSRNQLAYGG